MTDDHGKNNARSWLDSIVEMIAARDALEAGDESAELNGETFADADDLRQRIEQSPLSVEVRGGWHTPGDTENDGPEEYRILLTTGGPALQIRGDLGEYGEPSTARLEYQDWGTPWTEYHDGSEAEDSAVLAFARCFYFGEG